MHARVRRDAQRHGLTLRPIRESDPRMVAVAASKLAALGMADRCALQIGDLLESVPRGADVYSMQSVLHGYGDDNARRIRQSRILQNWRAAMASEGRLLVIEVVLPTSVGGADPATAKIEKNRKMLLGDLNKLAVTGGRERSEAKPTGPLYYRRRL